jgi:3-phenylpropionate/trans-cinnamate dioxygenase ferredoxin reductase component
VAAGLRDGGFGGDVVLVGAEPVAPYERPHLSKGYLAGSVARDAIHLRPATQYRQLGVDLELGRRVAGLEPEDGRVLLDDGKTIGWDLLCLAPGSDARRLPGFESALYLRELREADRLKDLISRGDPIHIVGAGFIGCEVAAVARGKGCDVRVDEALAQPLERVVGAELGAYIARVHRDHGVDLRLDAAASGPATLVAVGSIPRAGLAERAGLKTDGGIVVDELGRTSAPNVFAAGDATRFFHPLYDTHVRVEHFQTAERQGFAVGRTMAGASTPYGEVPWFWSDQYDLNLQYAGAGLPWDEVVLRGELGTPPFTVFYLSGGKLVAAAGINDHHTVARARRVMQARRDVTRSQLEDPRFDLRRALH